jgi:hypothetical protein
MRAGIPLVALLSACAGASVPERDDPPALAELLQHRDPFRREEAAHRLSILGVTIPANRDTTAMREELRRALQENSTPERKIWRAWHLLRAGCLARDGALVEQELAKQGFGRLEIYEPHGRVKFVRYLAERQAYQNDAGDRHDLFFWVQSVRKGDSWIVREVYAGLVVKFESPFKQLAGTDRYPQGSVLGRFFALEELEKLAAGFPVLEEVELAYGRIRIKSSDDAPAGFHVNAGFVMEGKAGGRSVCYTAESGLDPREIRQGRLAWDGFESTDALGPLTLRGGGFWGGGAPKPNDD